MTSVSDSAVETFRRDGFLVFDQLCSAQSVAALVDVYDRLMSGEIDCAPTDRKLGGLTRQIMNVWQYHPIFRDNEAFVNAREIARALLGAQEVEPVFDMLIYKGPRHTATTPWHQDYAYATMPYAAEGTDIPWDRFVQFWVALDDVDEQNGCMQFVPGAHLRPLLPHYVASGELDGEGRLLAITDPEKYVRSEQIAVCPLGAGGATVHNWGTLHFTSGNHTADRPRRAYIFNFSPVGVDRPRRMA